ncbi:MAG: hypothetical protein PHX87_00885 [Candidatus Peribacteraceae bacterium]|nr:hypothetical protein [Candidatus Peribacteraceae bacterium]MDD5741964.1 hypothetical protein [Candidatus Peribacteraceae bacterium]
MELLSLAIVIVLIGALFSIGWQLGPLILVGAVIYGVIRYRKQIPGVIRGLIAELRGYMKK